MRMRVEFDLDTEAFNEEEFSTLTNLYLEQLDATGTYWGRIDYEPVPGYVANEPEILSPGNSAYVAGEGGEVNSPLAAAQAQDEEAKRLSGETEAVTTVDETEAALAEEPTTTSEPEGGSVTATSDEPEPPTTSGDMPVSEPVKVAQTQDEEPVPPEPTAETGVAPAELLEPTTE